MEKLKSLKVSEAAWKRIKIQSIEQGVTMQEVVDKLAGVPKKR